MKRHLDMPSFDNIAMTLKELGVAISASEAHGLLCGLLCGSEPVPLKSWLELLQNDEPLITEDLDEDAKKLLMDLVNASEFMLHNEELGMKLLLPEDDEGLIEQTQKLGEWCHGFVTGIGLSGCYINQQSDRESAEVLQDLVDIGKITVSENGSEEEQQAFVEVVEYVQVAVLMLFRSLQFAGDESHLMTNTLH